MPNGMSLHTVSTCIRRPNLQLNEQNKLNVTLCGGGGGRDKHSHRYLFVMTQGGCSRKEEIKALKNTVLVSYM